MHPYIQSRNGIPGGVNFFTAYQGFCEMGLDCALFNSIEELDKSLRPDVVVGGLGVVRHALARFGVEPEHKRGGRALLVEVNDGYALGCYGLQRNLYAKLLSARWAQLVGVPDERAF